jgi:GNAT superfamily N-acetyltransferase
VCRVRPGDASVFKEVRLAALLDTPSAFGSTYADEVTRTEEHWMHRALLASAGRDSTVFLAWMDGRAVGIVGGYRPDPSADAVELVSMWTAPQARRIGVGALLVQAVTDWAIENDSSSIGLWVTRGNAPAEALYESLGFQVTGEYQPLPSDPCKDEVRMTLDLTPHQVRNST